MEFTTEELEEIRLAIQSRRDALVQEASADDEALTTAAAIKRCTAILNKLSEATT